MQTHVLRAAEYLMNAGQAYGLTDFNTFRIMLTDRQRFITCSYALDLLHGHKSGPHGDTRQRIDALVVLLCERLNARLPEDRMPLDHQSIVTFLDDTCKDLWMASSTPRRDLLRESMYACYEGLRSARKERESGRAFY
jgi:hypothetical protein